MTRSLPQEEKILLWLEKKQKERVMKYYGIPDLEHVQQWAAMGIPFEYNDFMWPQVLEDPQEVQRRIRFMVHFWTSRSIPATGSSGKPMTNEFVKPVRFA